MASSEAGNADLWLEDAATVSMAEITVEQKKQLYRSLKNQPDGTHYWCKLPEQTRLVCISL